MVQQIPVILGVINLQLGKILKEIIKKKILQEIRLADERISKRLSENIDIAEKEAPYLVSSIVEHKVLISVKCTPNAVWFRNSISAEFASKYPKIESISYMVARVSCQTVIPESKRIFEDLDDSVGYACELLGFVENE